MDPGMPGYWMVAQGIMDPGVSGILPKNAGSEGWSGGDMLLCSGCAMDATYRRPSRKSLAVMFGFMAAISCSFLAFSSISWSDASADPDMSA